jgi:hypothetical protein
MKQEFRPEGMAYFFPHQSTHATKRPNASRQATLAFKGGTTALKIEPTSHSSLMRWTKLVFLLRGDGQKFTFRTLGMAHVFLFLRTYRGA